VIERHIRTQRTARFYLLGTPGTDVREIWVACHGYGQLARSFAEALEPLRHESRIVVVPEGLSRFYLEEPGRRHGPQSPVGASWMTREDREREIADYVEYLDALTESVVREAAGDRRPFTVVALGFSQGVATATRWTTLGRTSVQRLIVWGGTLPDDLPVDRETQLFRGATLVLVGGRGDRLVSEAALVKQQRTLHELGVDAELLMHDGGHALNSEMLRRLAGAASSGA
jgi:predicted esterase